MQLELSLPIAGKALTWRLYNALGQQLLKQENLVDQHSRYQLSLEELPKGIYFLEIEWEGQREVKPLVHQ